MERELTADRITSKMRAMMYVFGKAPFGCTKNKEARTLEEDPNESPKVKDIFKLYAKVSATCQELARKYNKSVQTVTKILRNKTYLEQIVVKEKIFKGKHPALVTQTTFDKVQKRLPQKVKSERMGSRKYDYLLSRLVKCSYGYHLRPYSILKSNKKKTKKTRHFYYKCTI